MPGPASKTWWENTRRSLTEQRFSGPQRNQTSFKSFYGFLLSRDAKIFLLKRGVYEFARAAVTKYHRLGYLKNRHLFPHNAGGWKSTIKVPAGCFPPRPLPLACRSPPVDASPCGRPCVHIAGGSVCPKSPLLLRAPLRLAQGATQGPDF